MNANCTTWPILSRSERRIAAIVIRYCVCRAHCEGGHGGIKVAMVLWHWFTMSGFPVSAEAIWWGFFVMVAWICRDTKRRYASVALSTSYYPPPPHTQLAKYLTIVISCCWCCAIKAVLKYHLVVMAGNSHEFALQTNTSVTYYYMEFVEIASLFRARSIVHFVSMN